MQPAPAFSANTALPGALAATVCLYSPQPYIGVQLAECTEHSGTGAQGFHPNPGAPTGYHLSVQVQPACFPAASARLEQPLGIRELMVAAGDP